ncbi:unnamed protein product, partial [Brassica rapa subsp. narinosa]
MCKCRSHGTFPLFGLQSSHLNICYYHQDLHRRPLRPGSRPRFCSDRRALLLIEAWLLPRRPGIGRALQRHPFSGLVDSAGIVHHLSGPDRHAHTRTLLRRSRSVGCAPVRDPANQLPCALRVYSPVDSHTCQTPWSVFQDGSNGEPTGRRPEHADAEARPPRGATGSGHDGALTLSGAPFQGTWARSVAEDASPDYNSNAEDVRFSSWALPGSLAVTKGILTCPRPEGLGRNLRSKTRWFTGFCNSHQVSHFATFFIDARAEISVAESRFRLYIAALLPNKHRLRVGE